ncbi:MAG: ATPase [Pseudomonas sp.]|uniref:ATPase n=1 Tax=Pseudomonas sp. TaxID=306 RepID=UPI0030F1AE8D
MRNDALDELDNVPSLTTDARDHEFPADHHEHGRHAAHVDRGYVAPGKTKAASTGPLWALVAALMIAFAGLGWWSHQQIDLMSQQLVATQESFARISEDAAGRIQDISGKVVATESNVTSGSEALRLQVKSLETKVADLTKQLQSVTSKQTEQSKRADDIAADLKTTQDASGQFDGKLKTLASDQAALKAAQGDNGKVDAQLKSLSADIEALKKQGNPNVAISRLEQDLLVLKSEQENRPATPAASANTSEFDAFRAQMTRNISTLQSQVQNLQQQLNARQ